MARKTRRKTRRGLGFTRRGLRRTIKALKRYLDDLREYDRTGKSKYVKVRRRRKKTV